MRPAAVAGSFYPAEGAALRRLVERLLREARPSALPSAPVAIVVPHAGYVYSGPVAASAYAALLPFRAAVGRVAIFGPSHFVAFDGMAVPAADAFATPLGEVPVDPELRERLTRTPAVRVSDTPHALEHSLEVQLPFLVAVLGPVPVLPAACGDAEAHEVADAMEVVGGAEALIVVSTDLSHYHDWATARRLDEETARAVEALEPEMLRPDAACGRVPLAGLLLWARRRGLQVVRLDLRNSGDTEGDRDRVVGYGSWAFVAGGGGTG